MVRKGSRSLFVRFFLSYTAVLLVPLAFATIGYLRLLGVLEHRTAQEEYVRFTKYTELLDQRFRELEATATQLALSPSVRGLLDRDSPFVDGTVIPRILELQEQLSSLALTNTFVVNVHVFLKRAETVVSSYHTFFGLPSYYGRYLSYGGLDIEQWTRLIYQGPHQREYLPAQTVTVRTKQEESTTQRMVLYVQSLPMSAYSVPRGAIVAFLPEQEALGYLGWTGPGSAAAYLIMDANGRPIAGDPLLASEGARASGAEATRAMVRGIRVLLSQVQSPESHWRYLEAVPATVMSGREAPETLVMVALLLAALIAGVLLSSLVASRTSRPIANTLRLLVGGEESSRSAVSRNELDFLQDSVVRLVESDRAFRQSLREQEPRFRIAFLERMLTGGFETEEEARLYLSQTSLPPLPWPVRVLLVRINERRSPRDAEALSRITAAKAVVHSRVGSYFSSHGYVHDADFDLVAVLVEESQWAGIGPFAASLLDMLAGEADTGFSFGVGEPAGSLREIARAAREAREALAYKPSSGGVVFHEEIPTDSELYYPLDFAPKFISFTMAGDEEQIRGLLEELRERNCVRRRASLAMQRQLEYAIRDTLTRLIDRIQERDPACAQGMRQTLFERFDASTTMEELFGAATAVVSAACRTVNVAKKSHNVLLRDRILDCLNARYADPSVYLPSVAEEFGITKEYLSQFFKEQTGENFSVYLERLRIRRAKDLLSETDWRLSRIARQCGYNSLPVFRQAFKRLEGVTPSQFRAMAASHPGGARQPGPPPS
ncbi:MAG TPA: helix-turn-helix transcriptional regulator [Spirochaetia bacterium]|nr:helix-turn-helix transcriptional regulator [Spirochaetia bacterium]